MYAEFSALEYALLTPPILERPPKNVKAAAIVEIPWMAAPKHEKKPSTSITITIMPTPGLMLLSLGGKFTVWSCFPVRPFDSVSVMIVLVVMLGSWW